MKWSRSLRELSWEVSSDYEWYFASLSSGSEVLLWMPQCFESQSRQSGSACKHSLMIRTNWLSKFEFWMFSFGDNSSLRVQKWLDVRSLHYHCSSFEQLTVFLQIAFSSNQQILAFPQTCWWKYQQICCSKREFADWDLFPDEWLHSQRNFESILQSSSKSCLYLWVPRTIVLIRSPRTSIQKTLWEDLWRNLLKFELTIHAQMNSEIFLSLLPLIMRRRNNNISILRGESFW